MKNFLCIACLSLLAWSAFSQGPVQLVVPNGLTNVEGNSSSSEIFSTTTARLQQVYAASEFMSVSAPTCRIDAISFRFDGSSTQGFLGFRSVTMSLSTTTRSPDSLSPVYDDNAGPDAVLVFGGMHGFFATNTSTMPRSFELRIPLTTPFFYEPAKGNLSLGLITSAGATAFLLDAQNIPGDGVGRVIGGNTLSGAVDTLGFVTRFEITAIPEPSVIALFCAGTLIFCCCCRRTSNGARTK